MAFRTRAFLAQVEAALRRLRQHGQAQSGDGLPQDRPEDEEEGEEDNGGRGGGQDAEEEIGPGLRCPIQSMTRRVQRAPASTRTRICRARTLKKRTMSMRTRAAVIRAAS